MKTHFSFDGAAARSQFWGTTLIGILLFAVVFFLSLFLIGMGAVYVPVFFFGILVMIASIVFYAWVQIAVTVKRCRDSGISPLWTIATFVPYIGAITFIVIGVLPTEKRD